MPPCPAALPTAADPTAAAPRLSTSLLRAARRAPVGAAVAPQAVAVQAPLLADAHARLAILKERITVKKQQLAEAKVLKEIEVLRGSRRSLIGLPPTIQRAPGEDTDAPGGGEAQEAKAWQEGALSDPFEWLCADSCDFATFGLTPTAGTVVKHRSMESTGSPFPHQNTKITDFFLPAKRPPGSPGAGPKVAANEDTVAVPLPTAEAEEAEDQQEGAVGDRLQPCAESGEPVPNRWVGSQPALPFPPTMQPSAMARQEAWDFDTAALLTTTAAPVGRVGGEAPVSSDEAAEAQGTPEPFSARADQGGVAQVHEEEEADKRPWSEAEETSWPNRRGNGDPSTEDVENSNVNRRHLMQAAELAARKAFIRTLQPQAPARLDWADIGEDQDDEDGADIADIHFLEPRQPGRPHGRPPDDKVPRDQGAKAHIDNFAVHDPPQVAMASNTGTTCLAEKQLHGENWGPDGAQILAKGGLRKGARSITPPVVLGVDSTLPFGGAWRGAADGVGMQSQQACAPPAAPKAQARAKNMSKATRRRSHGRPPEQEWLSKARRALGQIADCGPDDKKGAEFKRQLQELPLQIGDELVLQVVALAPSELQTSVAWKWLMVRHSLDPTVEDHTIRAAARLLEHFHEGHGDLPLIRDTVAAYIEMLWKLPATG